MKLIFNYDTEEKTLVCINDKGEVFDNLTSVNISESYDSEKAGKFDCYMSSREDKDGMWTYKTFGCLASKTNKVADAINKVFKNLNG